MLRFRTFNQQFSDVLSCVVGKQKTFKCAIFSKINTRSVKRPVSLASLTSTCNKLDASSFPIIPRIRTFLPHPIQQPHRCILQAIKDIELWANSLIANSIADDSVRSYFDPNSRQRRLDDPCVYTSLLVDPNCHYDQLFEYCKFFVLATTFDDLLEFDRKHLAGQEVFDYMTKFKENLDFMHDSDGDHKRHFLLNLVGHSLTGLRLSGMNTTQFRRQIETLETFSKMHTDNRKSVVNWSKYWPTRIENAGYDLLGNLTEASYGFEPSQQVMNDPDVQAIVEASTKLNIITNDLVSYFREQNTVENDFNSITFFQKQMNISLQEAVDRCVEHTVHIHHQWVSATESALRSKVTSKWFPELEYYLKTIIPRAAYGCMTTYELISRNRADRRQPDFNRMLATGRWTCDEAFFNESDPNNAGRSFDQYLEKYEHLKGQTFL